MPDPIENENPAPEEKPEEEVIETPPEEKPEEKPALSVEQLTAELTKVRGEAANYRVKLREAEAKLSEAKTPEDIAEAVAEFKAQNAALERAILVNNVAAKYELPAELAARLQGEDEAALDADAKALAALVAIPKMPESLTGGLTPGDSDDEFDPVAAAHAAKKRRW